MDAIIRSTSTLVDFVGKWDSLRQHPDVCDFAFGNPQEVAIPGFAETLARHSAPKDKDWYAYKRSEPDARAVVAKPRLILADEPTGNLHSAQAREIMELFRGLNREGTTIVQVTHSEENARYSNRIVQVKDGWVVRE